MPRYRFHVLLAGTLLPDPKGQELPDADAAWEAARHAARDLMQASPERSADWLRCSFQVRDESDEIVLEFPFVEAIERETGPVLN